MRPLSGLKILDFTTLLPGPFATLVLSDLGAEVLRVEAPNRVDLLRLMPPLDGETSAAYQALNRNKRCLSLNLKQPNAIAILKKLLADHDILIEQFRPGVLKSFGLDYPALREEFPRLIYCSLTGYGQDGPYANRAGHDINYLALSGINSYSGTKLHGPPAYGFQLADVGGGSMFSVSGILAAVIERFSTGLGQHIDISMLDATLSYATLQATEWLVGEECPTYESGFLNGGTHYNNYRTSDGRYLSVGSLEPQFLKVLAEALDLPQLLKTRDLSQLYPFIREKIIQKTLAEWISIFAPLDACVEPVLNMQEMQQHPQVLARKMIVQVPRADGTTQSQIGQPIRLSNSTPLYKHVGPKLGQHNQEILTELGYSVSEIDEFKKSGTI